jgi:hypothetical protein
MADLQDFSLRCTPFEMTLWGLLGHPLRVYYGLQGAIVPIALIHPHNSYHTPEVQLVVFPRYVSDADGEFIRMSQAQACTRLMGCVVNVRNLSGHGLGEVSRLVRQVPAYALTYGRLDHLADKIAALLEQHLPLPWA